MKRFMVGIVTVGWLLVAGAASAEVNCAQVNRYIQTGRTAQEVSETMVISEDDVKKCQAQGAGGEKPQAPPPAGATAPAAPSGGGQSGGH